MSKASFYLSGAGATLLTSILDAIKNPTGGTVMRVGDALRRGLLSEINLVLTPNFWAIILIVLVSLFVCWVFEASSRLDAFLRGCTILAAFSIGSPDPIINSQRDQTRIESGGPSSGRTSENSHFFGHAFAQGEGSNSTIQVGSAYFILRNLTTLSRLPTSLVMVFDKISQERLATFQVNSFRIEVTQPYGNYTVQVETPGFASIQFDLLINAPVSAYDVNASSSSFPASLQRLVTPQKVELTTNEGEKLKQIGRRQVIYAKDFEAAIATYKQALTSDSNDSETLNFLGYAYFRAGRLSEAQMLLTQLLQKYPQNGVTLINLVKTKCAKSDFQEARILFQQRLARIKDVWANDGEFKRVCAPIIPA